MDTILWDNDGVLVDTEKLYFQATYDIMAGVGYELSRDEYVEYFLLQGIGSWHLLGIDDTEAKRLRTLRNERYSELLHDGVQVYDGVHETLEALQGKFQMGIVTSSRRDHFEIIHSQTELLPYFDFVLTSDEVPKTKPAPDLYLKGMEQAKRLPEHCIVVEDSARGLLAAHTAGIPCYVIPTDWTESSDLSLATRVLDSVRDLAELLLPDNV